ncbi:MAG: RNA polymerase sigma-70 factor [Tannerellaceae bacterium]|nr:RNA polymerase sigma-70 factor [Tannerellaceae bacterium]
METGSEQIHISDLYKLHYKRIYLFAKSYVHDKWIAEDIASETIMAYWEIIKQKEIEHPLTFLFSIARNKSIDHLRKELTRRETVTALSEIGIRELNTRISTLEACEPDVLYSNEVMEIMKETLASLPETTRKVFEMSRFGNLSKKDIAETMNMTPKGVEYHLSKALKSLRIALKDYLPAFLFFFFFQ